MLKNAIQFGRNAGIATALGIIVSDIIVIAICFWATASLLESITTKPSMKVAGAAILLILGVRFVWKASALASEQVAVHKPNIIGYFIQGFLVNGVNPFVFVVWIGFISIGKNSFTGNYLYLFLISILIGIFITDVLKSFLAPRIRPYLKPNYLKKAYQIIGFVLIGFSFRLLVMLFV